MVSRMRIKQDLKEIKRFSGVLCIGLITIFLIVLSMFIKIRVPLAYIISGSMEPTYFRGDLVVLSKVNGPDIKIGDVIVFISPQDPNTLILHRVVAIKFKNGKYYFLTKGDNPTTNLLIDRWGWVSEDNLYGKVVFRVPLLGYLISILDISIVRYLLLSLILLVTIASELSEHLQKEHKHYELSKNSQTKRKGIGGHGRVIKACILIGIMTLAGFSSYIMLIPAETKYDIEIKSVYFCKLVIQRTQEIVYYLATIVAIKSYGYWISSIRALKIEIFCENGTLISSTVWTILYNFHGVKEVALAFIIEDRWVDLFIKKEDLALVFNTTILIRNIANSYKIYSEKIFRT